MRSLRIPVHSIARRIGRLARAGRTKLRRSLHQLALALLVSVSLGEPLLCIVHCQIWLPLMLGQHMAAGHHHHMPGMDMSSMPGMSMAGMDLDTATTAPDTTACHIRGATGSDIPFHIPPSPVHELIIAFAIAIVPLLLIQQLLGTAISEPPNPFIEPPFQPPRPFIKQTLAHL